MNEKTGLPGVDVLEVFMHGERVGRIALTRDNLCSFQYDAAHLTGGASISPFHLPLRAELFVAKPRPFEGNFGVFDDSLPDGWGRFLFDRYLKSRGSDPDALTVLQRLCLIGENGRGALEYRPAFDADRNTAAGGFDFDAFNDEAAKLLGSDDYVGDRIDHIYGYGGSSGGARPKAFIRHEGDDWLVKFRAQSDPADIGVIEYEYAHLARTCGIDMPEARLFRGKYYGVRRFDRGPGGKTHTVSAAGLLNADYRMPSLDYLSLLLACQQLTRDAREVEKLFRLMVFNIIIANRDDHAKNFAFQLVGNAWKLAPAYDLLPSYGFGGYHTTTVNGDGTPGVDDILAVAGKSGIRESAAAGILSEVSAECKAAGMGKRTLET
jgi:serine/threonine-protein kinase HipA